MGAWVVAASTLLATGTPAPAQTPTTAKSELPAFGMIGLAKGQVAILNLVLSEAAEENHPGCQVTASFVDAEGAVFNNPAGNPIMETFTLEPRIAADLRLPAVQILAEGQVRTSIRAVLAPAPNIATPSRCSCLIASLELVNPNGQTTILDYGTPRSSQGDTTNPIPSPPKDGATPPPPPLPIAPSHARCTAVAN